MFVIQATAAAAKSLICDSESEEAASLQEKISLVCKKV